MTGVGGKKFDLGIDAQHTSIEYSEGSIKDVVKMKNALNSRLNNRN